MHMTRARGHQVFFVPTHTCVRLHYLYAYIYLKAPKNKKNRNAKALPRLKLCAFPCKKKRREGIRSGLAAGGVNGVGVFGWVGVWVGSSSPSAAPSLYSESR